VAAKLGIPLEQAAWGIHQVVNENMANAARVHVLERGKDPQRFPLFAFGGAGPVHGFRIAKALGAPSMIAPLGAGVMSTVGFLTAPLSFDFVRSWRTPIEQMDWPRANLLLAEMEAEGQALLETSGVAPSHIIHKREADMRYVGQGHEIRVPLPEGALGAGSVSKLIAAFETEYRQLYGRLGPPVPLEFMNWRILSTGPKPKLHLEAARPTRANSKSGGQKGTRRAYFPESQGFADTPVYDRYEIAEGATFDGPAIIEERESTVVVGPGGHCRMDKHANLIVELR
jgi:N-methylhydantoinase A